MALNQEDLSKFREQRERLGGMLSEASDVIQELNMTSAGENLAKLGKKVNDDTFKIQVIGTFKNGKSTFINSLLGEAVLPAYALPCTAVINEVKYGNEKKAVLYFRNPLPEKLPASISDKALRHMQAHNMVNIPPLTIPYTDIEEYVTIPMGMDAAEMLLESPYEKVELFWPLQLLEQGVEIIDSPGLNEAETRTRVTMDYLSKADAILFVLNAIQLCSQDEMDFIGNTLHASGFNDMFFVVNRFDLIPESQKDGIRKFAHLKLDEYTTNDIFFISAQQALDGQIENNESLYNLSGMPAFSERLTSFLTKDKGKMKLSQPARELKRILNNEALYKIIPGQRAMLESSLDDVKARYEKAKPQLELLKSKRDQIISKLTLRIEQSKQEFKRVVNRNTCSVAEMIPGWIQDYKPKHTIGLIPTEKKIQAAVTEITDYIKQQLIVQQNKWKTEVMMPIVNEKAQYIFDSSEKDLTKLYSAIDEVTIQITNDNNVKPEPIPVWQRIAGAAGGMLLGCPDVAIAGGLNGLTKELAKNIGLVLGTEAILGLLIGFTNPFVLVGGIIAAILGGGFSGDKAMKTLKSKLSDVIVQKICDNSDEGSTKVADSIASKLNDIKNDISSALSNDISQTEQTVTGIIDEMKKGQANIDRRKEVISRCEEKIKSISINLDSLTFELIEQK